jgi:DNA-binding NarL/FixJ family response regulator
MTKQVLLVDDHPGVALALKVSFRLDGRFEIADSACTAAEGLEKVDATQDVLVLDLHLPDLGGPELVRAFRARRPDLPVVLHSASADSPEIDAVRQLVDAVALKSRVDDLLRALAQLTGA